MRKVLIVDDELLARRMLKESIVWEEYGYSICGEAANGKDGLEKAVQLRPDLIFVDIKMPVMSGLTMVREIQALELGCEIVMLTCYEDFDYVREAMRCGAADYLLKHTFEDEDLKELLRRIEKRIQKEENRMESLNLLKENVFEKLISDTLSREKIRGYVETGILPALQPHYMVVCIRMQKQPTDTEKEKFIEDFQTDLDKNVNKMEEWHWYLSSMKNRELYLLLTSPDKTSVSEMKTAIKKIMTDFYRRKQEKEIGWLTGVTCRMFCRWEDLREAVKEAKDLTQGGEEYLACSAKVISAIEFIRNNYARQICLEDIAEYAGVSRVYLSQIFKKETGKNISDYLVEYRLGKAKELLLNSNLKIYTIAELCGFGSAQYFNKIFKKMNGISPYQLKDNKLQ